MNLKIYFIEIVNWEALQIQVYPNLSNIEKVDIFLNSSDVN